MFSSTCLTFVGLALFATPSDIPPELTAIAARMRSIETLSVHMRQEKELAVLGEVIRTEGELAMARPRRLVMDLRGPGGTRLVLSGDQMALHYKALDKVEAFTLSKDPRAKAIADHLFLLLDADPIALDGTYELTVLQKQPVHLRLVPKAPGLRQVIAQVDIQFDPNGFVDSLVLKEGSGDTTRWLFDDPIVNQPLDDSRFALPKP